MRPPPTAAAAELHIMNYNPLSLLPSSLEAKHTHSAVTPPDAPPCILDVTCLATRHVRNRTKIALNPALEAMLLPWSAVMKS